MAPKGIRDRLRLTGHYNLSSIELIFPSEHAVGAAAFTEAPGNLILNGRTAIITACSSPLTFLQGKIEGSLPASWPANCHSRGLSSRTCCAGG